MLLKQLTEAFGPSGCEQEVRKLIIEAVRPYADRVYTDVLGNLYVEANLHLAGPKIMLCAHMDEVGLMIVQIEDNGLLKFRAVGGIDHRILLAKVVKIGPHRIPGVIGAKAIHLQSPEERTKPLPIEQLYIDIGARSREEAEEVVSIGDYAVFATDYRELENGRACAKAFDDRIGCAVLIEVLKACRQQPLVCVFTVQEEIGLRGAGVAAYRVQPEIAIVIEGTICFDVVGAPSHGQGTIQGRGPALSIMDASTIANRSFLQTMKRVAEMNGIPYQIRRAVAGGNDVGAIHLSREGVRAGAISIPTRYIHAPAQIISLDDYRNTIRLVNALVEDLTKEENDR
jgi:putative aminopeptidase FrvX